MTIKPILFRARASILGLTLASTLIPPSAAAYSFNRNQAHIKWKVSETEHFRFNYPAEIEPVADYVAGIAESVAEDKLKRYNIHFDNKVEFILREDIFSNGWANSLQNTMNIWITDWDFPIRSTHNWLKDVVTHEFSHLVSIQSSSKLPSWLQGLFIGYQDFYNEANQASLATIIPFTSQPDWFAEGVAQYESERSGFDAWDSHRDMILRMAVLNNQLIGFDRMGSFVGSSLQYEQGPYTQGFALTRYISSKYGDEAMIKLWAENARIHRQTLSGSMQRVLGKTGDEVWEDWKNEITKTYTEQVKDLGPQITGQKLTSGCFYNYYPKWDSKGQSLFFVSNQGRKDFRSALYKYTLADSSKPEKERDTLVTAGLRNYFDVNKDDSTFLFFSAKEEDKNGSHKFDIYQTNVRREAPFLEFTDKTEKRFTENLNAVQASYNKEKNQIVFIKQVQSNFQLCTAPVPEGKKLNAEEVKTIFPSDSILQTRFGFNIYTPRFSPDGKNILFSYFDGASRNIGMVQSDGKNFSPLLAQTYDERDPEWTADGKAFYFSSDSTGIYNIYRYNFEAKTIESITNVAGGAFSPAIDSSGQKLAYINYDQDGFSLYLIKDLKPSLNAPQARKWAHPETATIEAIDLSSKSENYMGTPNRYIVSPLLIGSEMSSTDRTATQGELKWLGGFNGMINDPIMKNEVSGALLLELGNGIDYIGHNSELLSPDKESQFYLGIVNNSFPVSIGAQFSRANIASHDTVRIQSATADDKDRIENQNYAVILRNAEAHLHYNLFDASSTGESEQSSYLHLAAGYSWNDFNFYDLESGSFAFTYFKNNYYSALLHFYSPVYSDKGDVAPLGLAAFASYIFNQSQLQRQGTFLETFVFSNGVITPLYRNYNIQEMDLGASYALPLPWSKYSSALITGSAGSILDWKYTNRANAIDTLDSFFSKGLFLRGYPYLRNNENLQFRGEHVAKLSVDINQALIPNIYQGYWIFFIEDIYAHLFWEMGRAWNGNLYDTRIFNPTYYDENKRADSWVQSLGWGLKLNAKSYHNYPFLVYLEMATGLNRVLASDGKALEKLESIKVLSLETFATRIRFGISFGLDNGLLNRPKAAVPTQRSKPFFAH